MCVCVCARVSPVSLFSLTQRFSADRHSSHFTGSFYGQLPATASLSEDFKHTILFPVCLPFNLFFVFFLVSCLLQQMGNCFFWQSCGQLSITEHKILCSVEREREISVASGLPVSICLIPPRCD